MASYAQSPFPASFLNEIESPGYTLPPDASGVVIYGLATGLDPNHHGTCYAHPVSEVVQATKSSLAAGVPTITEVSPQSGCDSDVQDWKNVLLQLVVNIESAPNAGSLWGGVMLDEESSFWVGDSVSAFRDINNSLAILLSQPPYANGLAWYYTETFSGPNDWSHDDFDLVTGYSIAAPEIATDYMVTLTNYRQAITHEKVLVTWSLDSSFYQLTPTGLYGSEFRITGAPYHQFGLDLSNCWSDGYACNDWDADGVTNNNDNCISVYNPDQTNTDGDGMGNACDDDDDNDGCTDAEELGPNHGQGGQRDPLYYWDFYDVGTNHGPTNAPGDEDFTKDHKVNFGDTLIILDHFGHNGTDGHDHDLDRAIPDASMPGRSAEGLPGDSVTLTDAQNSLDSFGDEC
jgi:hypothetical protein